MFVVSRFRNALPRLGDAVQHDAVGLLVCDLGHLPAFFGFGERFLPGQPFGPFLCHWQHHSLPPTP